MIMCKKDLKEYIYQDKLALGITKRLPCVIGDEIWKYEILLRKTEYAVNCRNNVWNKIHSYYLRYRLKKMSLKLNFSIGLNVFDKGLSIAHCGTIVVGNAKIGKNCRIHEGVCIGATNGSDKYPQIGDNCFIGTGAKIIGDIRLGNNVAVGANATVVSSFEEDNITLGGVPAKIISKNNSFSNLNRLLKINNLLEQ